MEIALLGLTKGKSDKYQNCSYNWYGSDTIWGIDRKNDWQDRLSFFGKM